MVKSRQRTVDRLDWLRRWDAMQTAYLPEREARFRAMLDVLASLQPEEFVALDLACGPGAISQRLLARFPHARVIAVDLDPVLLALGQGALGTMGGRLRWVEADITQEGLAERLHVVPFDAGTEHDRIALVVGIVAHPPLQTVGQDGATGRCVLERRSYHVWAKSSDVPEVD